MCHMPVIEKLLKISRKHKTWKLTRFRRREEKPLSSDYFLKNQQRDRKASSHRPSWKQGTYGSGMKRNFRMWYGI